ncbi:cyclic nucleotide-binding/CBS domain-containing protein [Roseitalea porphyridii]|uniref:Cyclic nucleotide-binding/CBS domain-containing protein n=2 Tax=Roseitalea porphyridii TaxID=1852022 RepID=A0A4P6V1R7_9HYPH|nr:cyclic nucleotide-binding/CBS domain-containing protein [Roseitalea porphyridii]
MPSAPMTDKARAFADFAAFAEGRAPFRSLAPDHFEAITHNAGRHTVEAGDTVCDIGDSIAGLHVIVSGNMHLISPEGEVLADMHAGDIFGHRALMRDGRAILKVVARSRAEFAVIPAPVFKRIMADDPVFAAFFRRRADAPQARSTAPTAADLAATTLGDLMTANPMTLPRDATVRQAAEIMWDRHISCMLVTGDDGRLAGIVTAGDLVGTVIARGVSPDSPLSAVMTADPVALGPTSTMLEAVIVMTERRIGHLPVVDAGGRPAGIVTQTDLVRRNSNSLIYMIADINRRDSYEGLAEVVARAPQMLVELVASGLEGHQVGRMMTGVADAVTRRLIALAEERFGPAPAPFLWLACGSQGRMEQTGVSDQDNCLFLSDAYEEAAHGPWFAKMAKFVSDGLDAAGYFYCPGDMMATNPRWRQPVRVWRGYFDGWIDKPDPMAQMLASVMFDLRPIAGDEGLFGDLNVTTLERASRDSIFRAHMIANSLTHTPPLGLFGGLSLMRDREHRNAIDLKLSGVVPITDLARAYALAGRITAVNTRERLIAARDMEGVLSKTGGNDLIDAYDLIVELRLKHQTAQIRAGGKPDNFMVPDTLSALERNHLKDAFSVVKTLQSAIGQVGARR